MKKWVKVTLAIAGSLLTIVVLALVVVCTVIFTPEYITPIVKGQLDKNLPFKVDFSRADLVFSGAFPIFLLGSVIYVSVILIRGIVLPDSPRYLSI